MSHCAAFCLELPLRFTKNSISGHKNMENQIQCNTIFSLYFKWQRQEITNDKVKNEVAGCTKTDYGLDLTHSHTIIQS